MKGATGHLVVQSTDDGSSSSRLSPCVVLIHIDIPDEEEGRSGWYTLTIPTDTVDGEEGSILRVWKGSIPVELPASFAVLGSELFCVGGRLRRPGIPRSFFTLSQPPIPDIYALDINSPGEKDWIRVGSTISPRLEPHSLVIGGKLYVLSGFDHDTYDYSSSDLHGEVFDPVTGLWEALPDAPWPMKSLIISAALENPNRILVASIAQGDFDTCATFFTYDVQNRSWECLKPCRRNMHRDCPVGRRGTAIAVGNILYWITKKAKLLAYDLDLDLWLLGSIEGPGIPWVVSDNDQHIECDLFDVSPMPKKKKLRISFVSTIKYRTDHPVIITHCLLLKTVRSNSAHISQLPRIAPIDVDETSEDEDEVSWQSKDRWSSENDEINLSSQSDAIIAHIDKRMDHLKQFFTIQLDQMRKQLGRQVDKVEQLAWEHFTAERRQVGKVEQLVREQFATFTAERRAVTNRMPKDH
ncbi:hypothetical protein FH972_014727 [Carpinus fangiana]|uniref:Uncharacterized protein n=1 Tax=Carpinus fangiana TaxID=176857 RepID=A0A5N6RBM7_9ROSI|nr:hypothetical protein FH972_014727 [Carpinus fangiana]